MKPVNIVNTRETYVWVLKYTGQKLHLNVLSSRGSNQDWLVNDRVYEFGGKIKPNSSEGGSAWFFLHRALIWKKDHEYTAFWPAFEVDGDVLWDILVESSRETPIPSPPLIRLKFNSLVSVSL